MFKLLNTTSKQLTKHSRTTNVMLHYRYVIVGFVSYMFVLPVVILFKLVRCSTYYRSNLFYRITCCFIWFYVMLHYLLYIFHFFHSPGLSCLILFHVQHPCFILLHHLESCCVSGDRDIRQKDVCHTTSSALYVCSNTYQCSISWCGTRLY